MNRLLAVLLLIGASSLALAQEVTPRRWSHVPADSHFAGGGLAFTYADITFNPVLEIEDARAEIYTIPISYVYTFPLFDRSARVSILQAYQTGEWRGLLQGSPASTRRSGLADTKLRFAINLLGAPPLKGKDFADYRRKTKDETIVGAGLVIAMPTGEYYSSRLINVGTNRWTFRPQLGVQHTHGRWTYELTGDIWFYTENDDFWQDTRLELDPLYALQGHLIYTYRPGFWFVLSAAYGIGAESTVNGVEKNDPKENALFAIATGLPINRTTGFKLAWVSTHTEVRTGSDANSIVLSVSKMF